jgi:hypothetical protein
MKKPSMVSLFTSLIILISPLVAFAASPVLPNVDTLTFNSEGGYFGTKCTWPKWSGELYVGKSTSYNCAFKDKSVSMLVMGYSSTESGNGHGQAYFIRTIAKSKSGYESLTYAAVIVGIYNQVEKEIQTWIESNVPQIKNGKKLTKSFGSKKSKASINITIIGGPGEMRTVEISSK